MDLPDRRQTRANASHRLAQVLLRPLHLRRSLAPPPFVDATAKYRMGAAMTHSPTPAPRPVSPKVGARTESHQDHVRLTRRAECPPSANSGLMHRSKQRLFPLLQKTENCWIIQNAATLPMAYGGTRHAPANFRSIIRIYWANFGVRQDCIDVGTRTAGPFVTAATR
jgi:hypothetical protein